MLDILLVFLVTLFSFYYFKSTRHPPKFPPGPRAPIPIFGDAYVLGEDFVQAFHNLREKHGDVVGMWLGPRRAVAVFNYDDIVELLQKPESSNRHYVEIVREYSLVILLRDKFNGNYLT